MLSAPRRLVLPRLMSLIEKTVIDEMVEIVEAGGDVIEAVLRLVQPCQIHNADQLGDWCLSHLALNYNSACRRWAAQGKYIDTLAEKIFDNLNYLFCFLGSLKY